ncbi:unnamed protein product [Miscanthus lutarioriparius]|uniref:Legume lectin domain-containing protein n=1 Tax=Miscanthus lutarioriparius TaxID=422564 RepID=A0A811NCA5_9POAL|nr:unnamed protein product [Miscanthus lutarioriparius]
MAVTSSRCLRSTLCCLFYLLSSIHVPLAASLSFHFNFSDPDSTCTAQNAELACSGDAYFHSTENAIELTKNAMGDRNNQSVGRLTIKSGETLAADVAYDNSTETLSVTLRMNGAPYRVSANVDMRRSLPQMVAVGFSAATGRNVEAHQLLSWSFNSSLAMSPGEAPAPVPSQAITSKRHSKAHSSMIAVSAAAAVFVVICALIGFVLRRKLRIWKKSKEASGSGGGGELDDEHDGGEAEFEKGVGPKSFLLYI